GRLRVPATCELSVSTSGVFGWSPAVRADCGSPPGWHRWLRLYPNVGLPNRGYSASMIDGCNFGALPEPPDTGPYVRWCEREAGITLAPPPTRFQGIRLLVGKLQTGGCTSRHHETRKEKQECFVTM